MAAALVAGTAGRAGWPTYRAAYLDAARWLQDGTNRLRYNDWRDAQEEAAIPCRLVLADELLAWALWCDRSREDIRRVAGPWLDVLARAGARPEQLTEADLNDWPPHGYALGPWPKIAAADRVAMVRQAARECGDLGDTLRGEGVAMTLEVDAVASRLLSIADEVALRIVETA